MQTVANRFQSHQSHTSPLSIPGRRAAGWLRLLVIMVLSATATWAMTPAVLALLRPPIATWRAGSADPAMILVALTATVTAVLCTWLWLLWAWESVTVLRHHRRGHPAAALAPVHGARRVARRLAIITLGLSTVGAFGPSIAVAQPSIPLASTARQVPGQVAKGEVSTAQGLAATQDPRPAHRAAPSAAPGDGLGAASWRPTRPSVRVQPDPGFRPVTERPTVAAATPATVVVRRGDSLWSIAAAWLGPGATLDEIAEAWPGWYAANAAVIGSDPDRLLPGLILQVPPPQFGGQ